VEARTYGDTRSCLGSRRHDAQLISRPAPCGTGSADRRWRASLGRTGAWGVHNILPASRVVLAVHSVARVGAKVAGHSWALAAEENPARLGNELALTSQFRRGAPRGTTVRCSGDSSHTRICGPFDRDRIQRVERSERNVSERLGCT